MVWIYVFPVSTHKSTNPIYSVSLLAFLEKCPSSFRMSCQLWSHSSEPLMFSSKKINGSNSDFQDILNRAHATFELCVSVFLDILNSAHATFEFCISVILDTFFKYFKLPVIIIIRYMAAAEIGKSTWLDNFEIVTFLAKYTLQNFLSFLKCVFEVSQMTSSQHLISPA